MLQENPAPHGVPDESTVRCSRAVGLYRRSSFLNPESDPGAMHQASIKQTPGPDANLFHLHPLQEGGNRPEVYLNQGQVRDHKPQQQVFARGNHLQGEYGTWKRALGHY